MVEGPMLSSLRFYLRTLNGPKVQVCTYTKLLNGVPDYVCTAAPHLFFRDSLQAARSICTRRSNTRDGRLCRKSGIWHPLSPKLQRTSHARRSERATLARCASRRNAGPGNWAINWPQPPLDAVLRRRPNSKVEWQYCPKTRTALS